MGIIRETLMGYPPQTERYQLQIQLTEEELENILVLHIIDETDAEAFGVPESPPEPVNYPPANISKVSLGVHGKYLYVKFEFFRGTSRTKGGSNSQNNCCYIAR